MDFDKVLALFRALWNQRVEYVLVGSVGMIAHGIVRATQDVDLFVRPEQENVARLRAALRELFPDDPATGEVVAEDLAGEYPVIRYNSPDGSLVIDILSRLGEAFAYEELQYEEKYLEGVAIRVATPKMLYEMKRKTLRLQDRADAEALKERFGLGE